jgi:hypothetical protein
MSQQCAKHDSNRNVLDIVGAIVIEYGGEDDFQFHLIASEMPDICEFSQEPAVVGFGPDFINIAGKDPGITKPQAQFIQGIHPVNYIGAQVEMQKIRDGGRRVFLISRNQSYGRAGLKNKMPGFQEGSVISNGKKTLVSQKPKVQRVLRQEPVRTEILIVRLLRV